MFCALSRVYKHKNMDEKVMTMDELKGVVVDTVKDGIASIKADVEALKASKADTKVANASETAEFVKSLVAGDVKTITTNVASMGYTVPTTLANAIAEKKDKIAKIRKNAFVFQMDGDFQLPVEGTGVSANWITTEADSDVVESNPTTTKLSLTDNYLVSRVRIPLKLLKASAVAIESFISKLSARALASAEETAFVGGSGTGEPEGIRTASITGIAQASTSFAYDDLINLFYGVPEQYRANGKFLTSTAGMKLLRKLKDTVGLPIFNVSENTIFGKEVLESADIPANLGSGANETEIYFGDLGEYWIKDGSAMGAEVKPVSGRLQTDLFVYENVDGVVVNTDAFRKLTGVK